MTALVTLRDKPLGGNDSMPMVQVRCREIACNPSIEFTLTSEKVCKKMSICIAVEIKQKDFPLKPSITYSGCIIMAKNDLYTGIINHSFIQSIIHANHCIKIRTSTSNLSGTGPGKSDYTGRIVTQKTVPDTTALVTPRDKPLGENDSMPLVQVRYRMRCGRNGICGFGSIVCMYVMYAPCIRSHFFTVIGRQQLNYARICCFFRVNPIYSWIRIRSHLNARICCLLIVIFTISCIRSHFFTVIGKQQLNYAGICRFLRVIPIYAWIRSNFNLFSSCLGAVPDLDK